LRGVRRDAALARDTVMRFVPARQRRPWLAAINRVVGAVRARVPLTDASPEDRAGAIFFRLPYHLWSDFAFGVVPALAVRPARYLRRNFLSAKHHAVYDEIARLRRRNYVSGPFRAEDSDNVEVVIPLGAVPKKDTPEPRIILDATLAGLNDSCAFLKFKYPSFDDVIELAYPGCWYAKLDWKDAFFTIPIYEPFRRFFAFEHPATGEFFHYDVFPFGFKLSPFYYARLVQAYVDGLRLSPRFHGQLVSNFDNAPVHHRKLPLLHRRQPSGALAVAIEQYCDDGMLFGPSKAATDGALRQASAHVCYIGAIPKASKTVRPVQSGEHILGLGLDTTDNAMRISVPPERLAALRATMDQFEADHRRA